MAALMSDPVEIDFDVSTNATWDVSFAWAQAGAPVNLTGLNFKIQLRDPANPGNVVVELSTANERVLVIDAIGGIWGLTLSAATANGIPAGAYAYDVLTWLTNDPRVWRRQNGVATIAQGTTIQ
jgi:hypothetical protein